MNKSFSDSSLIPLPLSKALPESCRLHVLEKRRSGRELVRRQKRLVKAPVAARRHINDSRVVFPLRDCLRRVIKRNKRAGIAPGVGSSVEIPRFEKARIIN